MKYFLSFFLPHFPLPPFSILRCARLGISPPLPLFHISGVGSKKGRGGKGRGGKKKESRNKERKEATKLFPPPSPSYFSFLTQPPHPHPTRSPAYLSPHHLFPLSRPLPLRFSSSFLPLCFTPSKSHFLHNTLQPNPTRRRFLVLKLAPRQKRERNKERGEGGV